MRNLFLLLIGCGLLAGCQLPPPAVSPAQQRREAEVLTRYRALQDTHRLRPATGPAVRQLPIPVPEQTRDGVVFAPHVKFIPLYHD